MTSLSFDQMEALPGGSWWTKNHSSSDHAECITAGVLVGLSATFLTPIGAALLGGAATFACYYYK